MFAAKDLYLMESKKVISNLLDLLRVLISLNLTFFSNFKFGKILLIDEIFFFFKKYNRLH